MSDHYILDNRKAVPVDLMTWARWFELGPAVRRVGDDTIDNVRISTVFLGIDHSFGEGPPLLFETMVFGGELDESCERCETWDQAEAQHAAMCARIRSEAA